MSEKVQLLFLKNGKFIGINHSMNPMLQTVVMKFPDYERFIMGVPYQERTIEKALEFGGVIDGD